MKKIFALSILLLSVLAARADERPIGFNELPAAAQEFIKTHFAGVKMSYATKDAELTSTDYEVRLENGAKIEFNGNGEWTEVKNLENNGDGSVTGEFDHFCPVAFLVEKGGTASTPKTGDAAGQNLLLWIILMAVCVVAIVVLLILRKRKK